jgi:O-antigen/teichoic acid export membrane protein
VTDAHEAPAELEVAAHPRPVRAGRILANTVWRSAADLGSKLASIVLYVVMARRLGDTQFGVYTFALALGGIVTVLANFGQDVVLTREVARDHSRVHSFFYNTLAQKLTLAVPVLAAAAGILVAVGSRRELWLALLIVGAGVVFEDLINTCSATFQAYERLASVTVVLISERWLTAIVGVAALLAGAGVLTVAFIYAASAALAFVLALRLLTTRVVRPQFHLDTSQWLPLLRTAAPIGLSMVFAMVLFRVDTAMLAAFKPARAVGDYGAAYRLFESTLFLGWSVGAAVYPVMARLTRDTWPTLADVFDRALKLVVALTLPLAVGAAIAGEQVVVALYRSQFREGGGALELLAPTIVLYPVCYIAGGMLIGQDRQRTLTIVYGAVMAENILANLILIPRYSLYGAAIGTSISQLLLLAPLLALAMRQTGRIDWSRALSGPLIASGFAALALALLRDRSLAAAIAAGVVVYVGVLSGWELRFYADDARTLRRFLRRRSA